MRGTRAVLVAVAAALFVIMGTVAVAPAAPAVPGLGTVVWDGAPNPATLSPSSLPTAQVGDTFAIQATGGGMWVVSSGGQVSAAGVPCDGDVLHCQVSPPSSIDLTITALGTVLVTDFQSRSAVLTLGSVPPPAQDGTITVQFNGNGAESCTPAQVTGTLNSSYSFPSAATCIRPGHVLVGWSSIPNATSPDSENLRQPANLAKGAVGALTGDNVLYAIWQEQDARIQVTFDANVGGSAWCWDDDGNDVRLPARWADVDGRPTLVFDDDGARVLTTLVTGAERPAPTALCKPPFNVLGSWNTKADGSGVTVPLDKTLQVAWGTARVPSPLHLYAQWTWPNVTLMGDQRGTNGTFHGKVDWGSSVDVFEDYFTGVRCMPSGGPGSVAVPTQVMGWQWGSPDNLVYDTMHVTTGGMDGTNYYFAATDTLGRPAPHTVLLIGSGKLGSFGSPIGYGKPVMFEGQLQLPTVPTAGFAVVQPGSWSFVQTDWRGFTIATHVVGGRRVEDVALPLLTCPTNGVQEGKPVATLMALTHSDNPQLPFQPAWVSLVYHSVHGVPLPTASG